MRTITKTAVIAAAASLAVSGMLATGCSQPAAPGSSSASGNVVSDVQKKVSDKASEVKGEPETFWDASAAKAKVSLSAEDQARYSKAAENSPESGSYRPESVLATQLVAGFNYAYLVEGPGGAHAVAVVYEGLDGKASITSVVPIAPEDIKVTNVSAGELIGAWIPNPDAAGSVDAAGEETFAAAVGGEPDLALRPIAVLAEGDGQPTRFLAIGTTLPSQKSPSLFVVDVSGAEVADVKIFELGAYTGGGDAGLEGAAKAAQSGARAVMGEIAEESVKLAEPVEGTSSSSISPSGSLGAFPSSSAASSR